MGACGALDDEDMRCQRKGVAGVGIDGNWMACAEHAREAHRKGFTVEGYECAGCGESDPNRIADDGNGAFICADCEDARTEATTATEGQKDK